jgi:hypothetical protein
MISDFIFVSIPAQSRLMCLTLSRRPAEKSTNM